MAEKQSFWSTLPGMLTGIAAIITAVGGLLIAMDQIGVFDKKSDGPESEVAKPPGETGQPAEEPEPSVGQTEEQEPNEQISEATPIAVDTEVRAYLSDGGDTDVFAFETGPGSRNVFEITLSNQGAFAPDVMIYDEMNNRIENKYAPTPGADVVVPLSARPTSKYYIKVKDLDGFTGRLGDYLLTVRSK